MSKHAKSSALSRSVERKQRLAALKRKYGGKKKKQALTLRGIVNEIRTRHREYNRTRPANQHKTTSRAKLKRHILKHSTPSDPGDEHADPG